MSKWHFFIYSILYQLYIGANAGYESNLGTEPRWKQAFAPLEIIVHNKYGKFNYEIVDKTKKMRKGKLGKADFLKLNY